MHKNTRTLTKQEAAVGVAIMDVVFGGVGYLAYRLGEPAVSAVILTGAAAFNVAMYRALRKESEQKEVNGVSRA